MMTGHSARAHSSPETDSLDALATIMAVVTGILLFVLIATTVSFHAATAPLAREVADAEALATPLAVADARREYERLLSEAGRSDPAGSPALDPASLKARLAEALLAAEAAEKLAQQTAEAAERERQELARILAAGDSPADVSPEEAEKQRLAAQTARDEAARALAAAREANEKDRIDLAASESVAAAAKKVVRLPRPRMPPEGVQPLLVLCRHGRVYLPDCDALNAAIHKGIKDAAGATPPAKSNAEFAQYFTAHDFGTEGLRLTLQADGELSYKWRNRTIGESAAQAASDDSAFRAALGATSPKKHFVHLKVWSDTFVGYLEARQIASDLGFGVTWEPYGSGEEWSRNLLRNGGGSSLPIE